MKVFINNADGYFENVLCEYLNSPLNELMGTSRMLSEDGLPLCPQYITRHLSKEPAVIKQAILEADVIVYRLTDTIEDAKYAIKILESAQYNNRKAFILVSSVISWARTKRDYIPEEEEEEKEEEEEVSEKEVDDGNEEGNDDNEERHEDKENKYDVEENLNSGNDYLNEPQLIDVPPPKRRDYEPISEEAVVSRRPHVDYKSFLEIEKRVRKANCTTLKTFVLFSGIMYGRGEEMLHQFFKLAWMGDIPRLPSFIDGGNHLPLIHVDDVARICQRLINGVFPEDEEPEEIEQYMIAVDRSQHKFNEVMQSIAKVFHGSEELEPISEKNLQNYEYTDYLTLDLKFDIESGVVSSLDIEWKYQEGMIANMKKLRTEYEKRRNLTPLRIIALGPPLSGKSVLAQHIAKQYKIEYLTIHDMITEYLEREKNWEDELFALDQERILRERAYEKNVQDRLDLIDRMKKDHEQLIQSKLVQLKEEREEERAREKEEERLAQLEEQQGSDSEEENKERGDKESENETSQEEKQAQEDEDIDVQEEEELLAQVMEEIGEFDEEGEGIPPEPEPLEEEELEPDDPRSILRVKIAQSKKITSLLDTSNRFSDKAITGMVKHRLSQRRCKNQGWILEGYPKTVIQAKMLMLLTQVEEEGGEDEYGEEEVEEEQEENDEEDREENDEEKEEDERTSNFKANPSFMPEYVIMLNAEESVLNNRLNRLIESGEANAERFNRRMEEFRKGSLGENTVVGCLEGMVTKSKVQPISKDIIVRVDSTLEELFDSVQDFVGEPHNYGPSEEELEAIAKAEEERQRLEAERLEKEEKARIAREKRELEEREQTRIRDQERLQEVQELEKMMLEMKAQPLRSFLMEHIIPCLSQALVEVVQVKPEDPIDYLAQYLFKISDQYSAHNK